MKKNPATFLSIFFLSLIGLVFLSNCGGVDSVYYDGRSCVPGITANSSGVEIYQATCAKCHGALSSWTKPNDSATDIQMAISSTVPAMKYLSCLTSSQINSVAAALP